MDDILSPEETQRRRDKAIKKMLATPPKPHADEKTPSPAKRKAKAPRA